MCFNGKMKYEQVVNSANIGNIICPDLENFKDEDNVKPEVHWYKVLYINISDIEHRKYYI